MCVVFFVSLSTQVCAVVVVVVDMFLDYMDGVRVPLRRPRSNAAAASIASHPVARILAYNYDCWRAWWNAIQRWVCGCFRVRGAGDLCASLKCKRSKNQTSDALVRLHAADDDHKMMAIADCRVLRFGQIYEAQQRVCCQLFHCWATFTDVCGAVTNAVLSYIL